MQRLVLIIFILLAIAEGKAQTDFQTIVTQGPVAIGESFQVQYVLEDKGKDNEFFAPDFKDFRFVSGPNIYTGSAYGPNGTRRLKNIVYTLEAVNTGKFIIPGASARIENRLIRSGSVLLEVISKTDAYHQRKQPVEEINEDSYLAPGEDPYTKMRRNLFMRVLVDKKACYVGEPVTAVFKLYSRLDSKSDIVKNPGFYGFTVQDMINLNNRQTTNETINGKEFDVHIVRKVQLYPLQAGAFHIDAMEVKNKVRFSKSAVHKRPEQEIIEGIIPGDDIAPDANTVVFENSMSTEPIAISVRPTPSKNKPADYNGATGNFKLMVSLPKNELAKNEEGDLVITVSGKGNFTQLSAPVIQWPGGIDGFEPTVKDVLDRTQSPMNGKREFHFRFVSVKPGSYSLPTVTFSFFNPDTNHYKTISSEPIGVRITNLEKAVVTVDRTVNKSNNSKNYLLWWIAGSLASAIILFFLAKRRNNNKIATVVVTPESTKKTVSTLLQPAFIFLEADDKMFYNTLRNCIWGFFTEHFGLTGSNMSKVALSRVMQQKQVEAPYQNAILEILDQCETGIFTSVESAGEKKKLLEQSKEVLERIEKQAR
jgi:hypothetical protein